MLCEVRHTTPINKNPDCAIELYAIMRLALFCHNADKFPIPILKHCDNGHHELPVEWNGGCSERYRHFGEHNNSGKFRYDWEKSDHGHRWTFVYIGRPYMHRSKGNFEQESSERHDCSHNYQCRLIGRKIVYKVRSREFKCSGNAE